MKQPPYQRVLAVNQTNFLVNRIETFFSHHSLLVQGGSVCIEIADSDWLKFLEIMTTKKKNTGTTLRTPVGCPVISEAFCQPVLSCLTVPSAQPSWTWFGLGKTTTASSSSSSQDIVIRIVREIAHVNPNGEVISSPVGSGVPVFMLCQVARTRSRKKKWTSWQSALPKHCTNTADDGYHELNCFGI